MTKRSYIDPHQMGADNAGDVARLLLLGIRIVRAESRGKSTKRLEKRADRIQAESVERWNAKYGAPDED
ncbi:hypothetical protein ACFV4F_19315 [Kitasatospora sp. NPDC059722]|uniref:hypothetical protein n=1 Tax=Kitasatospora sp. NPDC059722 TaxID=3346925 RepID=UPI0036C4F5A3